VATRERKGMSAMDVVAVLTKVLQEQQKKDKVLKKLVEKQHVTLQEQQRAIEELWKQINELKEKNN